MNPTRPVIRYFGGKWRLAPWIAGHFPAHRIYVEPYCGAASVLMRKARSYAEIINDSNDDIVSLFRVLRDPDTANALRRAIELTPFARREFELAYQVSDEPVERARRLICRAAMGFGAQAVSFKASGFRNDTRRSGRAPAHDFLDWPLHVLDYVQRLRGVVIECKQATEILDVYDGPETLFYVDPPYPHSTRGNRKRYTYEMDDDNHRALAERLHAVDGMVVLSGYACDLYDKELYPDWKRVERKALADGARDRTEVLWLSPNIKQTRLFS